MRVERGYWSPYVVGAGLGLVVLASYLVMGFGPGASGAFAHVAARLEGAVAPEHAQANAYIAGYLESGRLWAQWIVVEVAGMLAGGWLGAWSAGRFRWRVERGPRVGIGARTVLAFAGGAVAGFASRVAQGCTSGVALSGGALLTPGAWAFFGGFMIAGFAVAWLVRAAWR